MGQSMQTGLTSVTGSVAAAPMPANLITRIFPPASTAAVDTVPAGKIWYLVSSGIMSKNSSTTEFKIYNGTNTMILLRSS